VSGSSRTRSCHANHSDVAAATRRCDAPRPHECHYSFIALCLVGFSVITIVFAETLASGTMLARALCIFLAVFWTLRLLVATFVFDMRPYLTSTARRVGYHAVNIVFLYLPIVYGLAASRPALP
jgi:hypothetical protein